MKTITLVPIGGLANRMNTIDSGICLANDCKSKLKIIWFKDKGLNCRFDKLFEPINNKNITLKESSWYDYILYDRPRLKNLYIPYIFQKLLFKKQVNECVQNFIRTFDYLEWAKNKKVIIMSCYSVYKKEDTVTSILKPIPTIQKKIDEISQKFPTNTIGVQIRRTDHIYSINESPTSLFIENMKKEKEDTSFFLATDSKKEKQTLINIFGKRIITMNFPIERNTQEGIQSALIEMFLLSKTQKIYVSAGSTFGERAAIIGHIKNIQIRK